jgi:hypothetical protein
MAQANPESCTSSSIPFLSTRKYILLAQLPITKMNGGLFQDINPMENIKEAYLSGRIDFHRKAPYDV